RIAVGAAVYNPEAVIDCDKGNGGQGFSIGYFGIELNLVAVVIFVLVGQLPVVERILFVKIIFRIQVSAGVVSFVFPAEVDRESSPFFGQALAPDKVTVDGLLIACGGHIACAAVEQAAVGSEGFGVEMAAGGLVIGTAVGRYF